jgi:hypothetical protein
MAVLVAAESHGVLPAVTRALGAHLEDRRQPLHGGRDSIATALECARAKVANHAGFGLLLTHHAGRVMQGLAAAGIGGFLVKGPAFARRLYPDAALRTFTDVDILVPEARRNDVSPVMRELGFELFEFEDRRGKDYHEQKWLLPAETGVMVEIHSNIVHSPKLRGSMSIRHEDVLAAGGGDGAAPTALLLVAAAHASVGHQCDRLQHMVDVVQAARGAAGPIDQGCLAAVARQCGLTLAVAAALDLAARIFHDAAAAGLAGRLLPGRITRLPFRLLAPSLVLRAQSTARTRGSWRRKVFRQALRLGVA